MEKIEEKYGPSLKLVAFGAGQLNKDALEEYLARVKEETSPVLPQGIIASIAKQNIQQRHKEAYSTVESFMNTQPEWDQDSLSKYIELRKNEVNISGSQDRVAAFLDNDFVNGYEIYARLRLGEKNILDPTFAAECLAMICERENVERNNEFAPHCSLPKVTRIIGNFAVVTTKVTIGEFHVSGSDTVGRVKSRQAGVVNLSDIDMQTETLFRNLALATPSKEDKYVAPRMEVREFLKSNNNNTPVVESVYLARQTNNQ